MPPPERRRSATLCLVAVGLLVLAAGTGPALGVPSGTLGAALPLTVHDLVHFDPDLARERLAEARERLRHRQIRRELTAARLDALEAEIADLRERWRMSGATLLERRAELADLDRGLEPLAAPLAAATAEARRRHDRAARALRDLALQSRRYRATLPLATRLRPVGAMVLSEWRASEAEAAALRRRRDELAARRAEAAAELEAARARAARLNVRLAERVRARTGVRAAARAARDQAAAATAEVESLLAELNRVATYRLVWAGPPAGTVGDPPEPAAPTTEDVAIAHFGERRPGPQDRGVTIEPRLGQAVTAPADGRVAFAGSFRSYGLLLIIDHGDGYHTVLSGMSRLTVSVDQRVRAGDPVATFGNAGEARPRLYVELRRNGRPVNPLLWLAAGDSKVSG